MHQEETRVVVGKEGRIVIPASIRNALRIDVGDELLIRIRDGYLELMTVEQKRARARDIVRRHITPTASLVEGLVKERRREAKRESG